MRYPPHNIIIHVSCHSFRDRWMKRHISENSVYLFIKHRYSTEKQYRNIKKIPILSVLHNWLLQQIDNKLTNHVYDYTYDDYYYITYLLFCQHTIYLLCICFVICCTFNIYENNIKLLLLLWL